MGKMGARQQDRWGELDPAPLKFWQSGEWWQARLAELPVLSCGRNHTHGIARAKYESSVVGRSLGYSCPICGWDMTVLVQEGLWEPQVPEVSLPGVKVVKLPGQALKRPSSATGHRH